MLVTATELKNKLGKYLREAMREEIIIVSNGRKVARLSAYDAYDVHAGLSLPIGERAELYAAYPRKATYEEFLELTNSSEERFEYIDGEIYYMAAPKIIHQQILGELYFVFATWFRGKNCRPMLAPFDITLRRNVANINIVQPDMMVICDLEEKRNEKDYYMGVPSLVVEILSESTRGKDSVKKLDLYLSTGVQEYWIINPFGQEITVFQFADGDVAASRAFQRGEIATSFIFNGLQIAVDSLFEGS